MICGVDEAGRGPVLGPMVVAAVAIENDAPLRLMEVRDSKKLTPARREELADKIHEICGWNTGSSAMTRSTRGALRPR